MIVKSILIPTVIGVLLAAGAARAQQVNVEQIVAQKVQPILPENGKGGGVAVAVRMNGTTSFFNYGFANNAQNRRVTEDSIFNLGSVGKVFATTLLAQAVKQGELSLDDPVAKYVTELQRGDDIRRVTLGQLASHTSGLPRVPQQYEHWHRGNYTWPDFVRFLNSWKADPKHEPGQQYLYSNAAMVLLRVALERRFNTRFSGLDARTDNRPARGRRPNLFFVARHGYVFGREHGRASRPPPDGECHGARSTARVHRQPALQARARMARCQRRQPHHRR
ncbi:MAG: hypothetical protein DMF07_01055 [Verrucomicrobia bacterium]|nr:MAG: hypothetical protein DMF07_01055 [Verrucomicrobiota bacterium]